MSDATLTADALLTIGMNRNTTPAVRLLTLSAERANREGVAIYDPGELQELLHGDDPQKTAEHVLHIAITCGYVLDGSTAEEIRLDTALVRPEGFAEIGARYGELILVREITPDRWLTKCSCGATRTFQIEYLAAGLTTRCNNAQKHRLVA